MLRHNPDLTFDSLANIFYFLALLSFALIFINESRQIGAALILYFSAAGAIADYLH